VEYQFYHSFAIGLVGLLVQRNPNAYYVKAAYAFILGIILFSGSLYLYVFTGITKIAMITPLGGTAFIIAWGLLAWGIWKTETLSH
jgi:uncharacterized membrane protein YgdD (TMEM256/DUF423 family)